MSTATAPTNASAQTNSASAHDWKEAGGAWGHAAAEWATLKEHYAMDILLAMFPRLGINEGVELLDIACGAGLGSRLAAAAGAKVSGIDASESLIEIARDRSPQADLRLGSMFELPWADETFDAAMSINGIWGSCEGALVEASRVLRPGAPIGISFWGRSRPLHLRDAFIVFAAHSPAVALEGMVKTNNIARDGVAESMLEAAGFEVVESGARESVIEWPDPETAWRAMRSTGPAVPALRNTDHDTLKAAVLEAIEHCRDDRGIYRFRNDHRFVIARKPA